MKKIYEYITSKDNDRLLITPKHLQELSIKEGFSIQLATCEQILEWCYDTDYRVDIIDDVIVMEDLQIDEENIILFDKNKKGVYGFISWWADVWDNKYDYSRNSIDRKICGDVFINNLMNMSKEIKQLIKQ